MSPPYYKYLHSNCELDTSGDATVISGDVVYDNSIKRSSNLTLFGKINKSGDGGGRGHISVIPWIGRLVLHGKEFQHVMHNLTYLKDW